MIAGVIRWSSRNLLLILIATAALVGGGLFAVGEVPAGFIGGIDGKETPDFPLGLTFAGRAWSEAKLLRLAYAYEQTSAARRPPPGLPAL